jgi:hypothetical protein
METAYRSVGNRLEVEIYSIQNILQIAQWRRLALDFLSTTQLQNLYTTLLRSAQNTHSNLLITKPLEFLQYHPYLVAPSSRGASRIFTQTHQVTPYHIAHFRKLLHHARQLALSTSEI